MSSVSLDEVVKGYGFLDHSRGGLSELTAISPVYRRGDRDWNRLHAAWPVVAYFGSERDVVGFVRRFAGERLVVIGLNPRRKAFRNSAGYLRGAFESEVDVVRSFMLDLDFVGGDGDLDSLLSFLGRGGDGYFLDRGLYRPVRHVTGRGVQLWFALPDVPVSEVSDFRYRVRAFREGFACAFEGELSGLGVRVDSCDDLRRAARVPGTAKPSVGYVSWLSSESRREDSALKDYLLNLDVTGCAPSLHSGGSGVELRVEEVLPDWFVGELEKDVGLERLYRGEGKPDGLDNSRSGYEFSLARRLLVKGYTDVSELATILALRPGGSVASGKKDLGYVRRTIANALIR